MREKSTGTAWFWVSCSRKKTEIVGAADFFWSIPTFTKNSLERQALGPWGHLAMIVRSAQLEHVGNLDAQKLVASFKPRKTSKAWSSGPKKSRKNRKDLVESHRYMYASNHHQLQNTLRQINIDPENSPCVETNLQPNL